ncbi:hypothetical protein Dimus_026469 [Dionaea muscipula]
MATEVMVDGGRIQKLFDDLETKRSILSTCTDLYKNLTSYFSSLEQSLAQKTQTLESRIQTLDSDSQTAFQLLNQRENSLPDRESSLLARIEAQKQAVIAELENPSAENGGCVGLLKSLCRRMDHLGLVKLVMTKRKELGVLRSELGNAIWECVDPPRLVLDVVEEFLNQKAAAKGAAGGGGGSGLADKRWACGMVVSGLFRVEELKEVKKNTGPAFSGSMVVRAFQLVEAWKRKLEESGEGLNGVGPAEAAMFMQLTLGFGFKDKFDDGFLKKLVLKFAARKDLAKLCMPVFGEKMGDIIDELVKDNKEIEAIYFASESGLTERFQPVALLNSYLRKSKSNATNILTSGKKSVAAVEESDNLELNSLRAVIRCVEDHKLEKEFTRLESLRVRLSKLEKDKAKKRSSSGTGNKTSSSKRPLSASSSRGSGPPHFQPVKAPKISNPYPGFSRGNPVPPGHQSPAARYSGGLYNYPTQTAYNEAPPPVTVYGSTYGGSHIPASAPIPTQHHYQLPADNVAGSYGAHAGYTSYDYGASSATAYQPTPYTQ